MPNEMEELEFYLKKAKQVVYEVKKTVVGKDEAICKLLMAILAKGHILIEDIPGVGKTTMALAFSKALGLECNRLQFTPDIMPSDLTGFNLYNRQTGQFEYKPGAVLCNILLADEINRTSPKTQSALLEVMEERRVTVDSQSIELPKPFMVMATQNPFGSIGTQKLPESQLDRFMIQISLGYPTVEDEIAILKNKTNGSPKIISEKVLTAEELMAMRLMWNKSMSMTGFMIMWRGLQRQRETARRFYRASVREEVSRCLRLPRRKRSYADILMCCRRISSMY